MTPRLYLPLAASMAAAVLAGPAPLSLVRRVFVRYRSCDCDDERYFGFCTGPATYAIDPFRSMLLCTRCVDCHPAFEYRPLPMWQLQWARMREHDELGALIVAQGVRWPDETTLHCGRGIT